MVLLRCASSNYLRLRHLRGISWCFAVKWIKDQKKVAHAKRFCHVTRLNRPEVLADPKPRSAIYALNHMAPEPTGSSIFPRTDWAELSKAAEADVARLDRLIRLYWEPLKIYLVATFPGLRQQADLLLQDFAEDKMLKEGWLRKADQSRGRFRDFLKTSLRNSVLDRLNLAEVKNPPISIEEMQQELAQPGAHRRGPRLVGETGPERVGDGARLRRLATPVNALERDQATPGPHVRRGRSVQPSSPRDRPPRP
jgi:hypothetical protein